MKIQALIGSLKGTQSVLDVWRPKGLVFDLWKTLARSTYPEPIANLQEILGYKCIKTDHGLKAELDYDFLYACLTTNKPDPDDFLHTIAARFGLPVPNGAAEKFRQLIDNEIYGLLVYPDVLQELKSLKDAGFKIALLSNVWPFPVPHLMKQNGLGELFDELVLSCEVGYAKPDPEIFLEVTQRLNLHAEDCLMVGDNPDLDVQPAIDIGMPVVQIDRHGDMKKVVPNVPVIRALRQLYTGNAA